MNARRVWIAAMQVKFCCEPTSRNTPSFFIDGGYVRLISIKRKQSVSFWRLRETSKQGDKAMKIRNSIVVVGIALSVLAMPLRAHHSSAGTFNSNSKAISLRGTISRIEIKNPHSTIYLDVKDAATGQIQNWKIEYGGWIWSAGAAVLPGVVTTKSSVTGTVAIDNKATFGVFKVGEQVNVRGLQAVDGSMWVLFSSIVDEQGKSIIG